MPARLIAHVPDAPASAHWVDDGESCVIGRGGDAGWVLPHASVSRRHARLAPEDGGWRLLDLGSKNGSFVDGARIQARSLAERHWLRLGEVLCEFERCPAPRRDAEQRRHAARVAQSTAWAEQLAPQAGSPDLPRQTLHAILALGECERGFLLLRDGADWRVADALAADGSGLDATAFTGSATAVARACATAAPLVVNCVAADTELAGRASVSTGGIGSLLVLPLAMNDGVGGVIYVDRHAHGQPFTDFDVELCRAFAERAAVWLAARRGLEVLQRWPG